MKKERNLREIFFNKYHRQRKKLNLLFVKAEIKVKNFFPCTFTRKSGCFKENVFQFITNFKFSGKVFNYVFEDLVFRYFKIYLHKYNKN